MNKKYMTPEADIRLFTPAAPLANELLSNYQEDNIEGNGEELF